MDNIFNQPKYKIDIDSETSNVFKNKNMMEENNSILFGINTNDSREKKRERLHKENQNYWQNVRGKISKALVGEKAEWGLYWDQGIGRSLVNKMSTYHFNEELGMNWQDAMMPEPEDTGIAERFFGSITTLVGD